MTRTWFGLAVALKGGPKSFDEREDGEQTATVRPMPRAVMRVVVLRTMRLRTLYASGIAIAGAIRYN